MVHAHADRFLLDESILYKYFVLLCPSVGYQRNYYLTHFLMDLIYDCLHKGYFLHTVVPWIQIRLPKSDPELETLLLHQILFTRKLEL